MSSDTDSEGLNTFLQETEEQLQRLDEDIVRLERERVNPVLLQEVLRIIQGLKDSCQSLGHHEMAKVADAMKGIVERVISGTQPIGTQVIDALLDSLDTFITLRETLVDPQAEASALPTQADADAFQEALAVQAEASAAWTESRPHVAQEETQPVHPSSRSTITPPAPSSPVETGHAPWEAIAPLIVQLALARGVVERLIRVQRGRPKNDTSGKGTDALAQIADILTEAQAHVLDIVAGDSVRTRALLTYCGGVAFAIPLENVVQAVVLDQGGPATPVAGESCTFQGKVIPVLRLDALLRTGPSQEASPSGSSAFGVVVTYGGDTAVLAADSLLEPCELLVRRVNGRAAGAECIGGAAMLDSGEVVLVLDMAALVGEGTSLSAEEQSPLPGGARWEQSQGDPSPQDSGLPSLPM